MSFYSTLQSKAATLLTKFGQDVTLRKLTAGAYDTSTGAVSNTNADTTLKAALFDLEGQTEQDQTLVRSYDKKALLQAGGAIPTVDDLLIVAGVTYSIMDVKETNPAGTPVLYELHLHRG